MKKKKKLPKKGRKIKKTKSKKTKKVKRSKPAPSFAKDTIHKTKVRVIGIGGGGGSIVSEILSRIKKADFVVANTDVKALNSIRQAKRFQFGQSITRGLGTGMNIETGEASAEEDKEKIKKLFEGQDICIIVSCLGGGAGSGGTPVFAKLSKRMDCLTYGIFTMPFKFEGDRKMEIAEQALDKIRPHLNAFSVIPNERIFTIIDKNTPLKQALSAINERLAKNLEGLIEMIYSSGLINIDFADLKTALAGRGKLAYLNTTEFSGSEEEAMKKVISSPLYAYSVKGAKGVIYNILGAKTLQLSEVSKLSKIIADSVNRKAKIIFGINQSEKSPNKIKITLLASGCATKGIVAPKKTKAVKKIKKRIIKEEVNPVEKKPVKKRVRKKPSPKPVKPKKKVKKEIAKKPVVKKAKTKKEKPKSKPKLKPKKIVRRPLPEEQGLSDVKLRRNALQVKKVVEEEEKELMERDNIWETPAIFRRKK